jgi:formamidopyrimidine-DNA glycosylase
VPELPDLVHVERKLRPIEGRRIVEARTGDPTVLRMMVREPLAQALAGRTIQKVQRRGHFMIQKVQRRGHFMTFTLDGELAIAINAMLVGRYFLLPTADGKEPRSLGLGLVLDDGQELRYVDDKRMGKVYVAPADQLGQIPQLGTLGIDPISPELTLERFRKLVARRRDQVRQFLMDKTALASIGNAYADEILFAARLHPKTFSNKLTPDEVDRLHAAIGDVLRAAIDEIARRDPPVETKLRDFVKVRGRDGKPCPACGTVIRTVRVGDGDACFCPKCQPTERKLFVDWNKAPR